MGLKTNEKIKPSYLIASLRIFFIYIELDGNVSVTAPPPPSIGYGSGSEALQYLSHIERSHVCTEIIISDESVSLVVGQLIE